MISKNKKRILRRWFTNIARNIRGNDSDLLNSTEDVVDAFKAVGINITWDTAFSQFYDKTIASDYYTLKGNFSVRLFADWYMNLAEHLIRENILCPAIK